ncbi:MAG: hypothetical protein HY329_11965 [Chloroflexi bacterium]|nr:hypothetical protein [Chloroflexota bacterium]
MAGKIQVVVPVGKPRTVARQTAPRVSSLENKSIGFIDNSKHNADILFAGIAKRLSAQFPVGETVERHKNNSSIGAPKAMLAELAERCDVVITGTGD